MMVGLNNY